MVDRARPSPTGRPRSARGRAASPRSTVPTRPGTKRGSRETAMWQLDVPPMSARRRSRFDAAAPRQRRADGADAAGMRVDDGTADRGAGGRRPSSAAPPPLTPAPTGAPMGRTCVPMRAKPFVRQLAEADRRGNSRAPSRALVPEVGPLADRGAERARHRRRWRGHVRKSGRSKKRGGARARRRQALRSQSSFGVCISGEMRAAHVAQHVVPRRVDAAPPAPAPGGPSRR